MGRIIDFLFWLMMFVVVIISAVTTMSDLGHAQSAPQQAAAAAMGMFGVITPYVLIRMIHMAGGFRRRDEADKRLDRIARQMEEMAQLMRQSEARKRAGASGHSQQPHAENLVR